MTLKFNNVQVLIEFINECFILLCRDILAIENRFKQMKLGVQQYSVSDCGAACLTSVARYYRLRIPLWNIRQQAGTNRGGTSAYGLVQAAEKIGFDAKGVEIESSDLKEIPLPAIAFLKQPSGSHHFVVIYKAWSVSRWNVS